MILLTFSVNDSLQAATKYQASSQKVTHISSSKASQSTSSELKKAWGVWAKENKPYATEKQHPHTSQSFKTVSTTG